MDRRNLFLGLLTGSAWLRGQNSPREEEGYRPLFDGFSLRGWKPRSAAPARSGAANWSVDHGVIVGGQGPHLGSSYLVSEEVFDDFDLAIDVWPNWPAAVGILIRAVSEGDVGIQVPLDYRPHGGVAGYYGTGLGGFRARQYAFSAGSLKDGRFDRLIPETPTEPASGVPLDFAAPVEAFLRTWKPGGWNRLRIRSVGALPYLTTWINGEKISELDTAKIKLASFAPKTILDRLGRTGHIALQVHGNEAARGPDAGRSDAVHRTEAAHETDARLGVNRSAPAALCRWRNIYIRTL